MECINTLDKITTRKKEAIHYGFAFNVPAGNIQMDIPWGVMTPEQDQVAWRQPELAGISTLDRCIERTVWHYLDGA